MMTIRYADSAVSVQTQTASQFSKPRMAYTVDYIRLYHAFGLLPLNPNGK